MCLNRVTDNVHSPDASGTGWKMFDLDSHGRLVSWYLSGEPYCINQWYEAYSFVAGETKEYWPGFHIFTTRRDAKKWTLGSAIRKIRWRHQLATGIQDCANGSVPCIVAKEILILPNHG